MTAEVIQNTIDRKKRNRKFELLSITDINMRLVEKKERKERKLTG